MPNTSNTLTTFPLNIDNFTLYENGTSVRSIIKAETWNNRQAAALACENHTRSLLHVAGAGDLRKLSVSGACIVAAPTGIVKHSFALTSNQVSYLNQQPWRAGNLIVGDAYRYDSNIPVAVNLQAIDYPTKLLLVLTHLDPTQNLTAGIYQVRATFLGQ